MNKFLKGLGILFLGAVVIVWGGFVLQILWSWFVSSPWDIRQITLTEAVGIDLIISFLTQQFNWGNWDESVELSDNLTKTEVRIIHMIIQPALFLFVGWVVTFFM